MLSSIKVNNLQVIKVDEEPIARSKNLVESGGVYNESRKFVKTENTTNADLIISDTYKNVLTEFKEGHIRTKNFDSRNSCSIGAGINNSDLDIIDEYNNVLVTFSNGHIRTKNFDSKKDNNYVLNVKDYGAIGDGVTDDTEALKSAMERGFQAKRPIYFPEGTYLIRQSLTLKSRMEIFGNKSTIKKKAATTTTLTQTAAAGSTTIYVASVSGFEVGDQFCISSEPSTHPAARHCSVGYITLIDTINNSITFVSAYDSIKHGTVKTHDIGCYVTNSFAIFRSWGMYYTANNIEIHDLILDGNRLEGEFGDWMNGCIHIDATSGTIEGITYNKSASNLTLRDLIIKNSPFDGVSDQGDGGLTISNCIIKNPYMHGIHLGTNYDSAKITSNMINNTQNGAAIFWCQNVQNVIVSENIIKDCYKGCSDYEYGTPGLNSIISENIFANITSYVFDFSHSGTTFKDKFIIVNNLIEDIKYMIANITDKQKVIFSNNILSNFITVPSYLFEVQNTSHLSFIGNISVSENNVFTNTLTDSINMGNSWN